MKHEALVLLGHPDPHSLNAQLAGTYAEAWRAAGGDARIVDLTRLDFDLVLRGGHTVPQPLEPALDDLRDAFERATHVAWFFPVYWGAPPAVVRGLVDRLFLPGWAFRYEGHALPTGLLRGRSSRVVATMDSPGWGYALAHRWALHAVMGTGTLSFCGFSPVDFTVLHAVRAMDAARRAKAVERLRTLGRADATRAAKRPAALPPKPGRGAPLADDDLRARAGEAESAAVAGPNDRVGQSPRRFWIPLSAICSEVGAARAAFTSGTAVAHLERGVFHRGHRASPSPRADAPSHLGPGTVRD